MPSIFEVLAQEVVPVQLEKAEGLRVAPGTPVIHVVRRKLFDGEIFAYTVRYLHRALCPQLEYVDLSRGSVHEILISYSELPLLLAEIEIEAHYITEEEAELLNAHAGDTAIVIRRMTYTAPNRPAVWYQAWFKNEFSFGVQVHSPDKQEVVAREGKLAIVRRPVPMAMSHLVQH
jgi:DNA-binding GntR family transcriptional regulator